MKVHHLQGPKTKEAQTKVKIATQMTNRDLEIDEAKMGNKVRALITIVGVGGQVIGLEDFKERLPG